jgi:hypothetical protein
VSWTGPEELKAQVQRLWDRGLLLAATLDDSLEFPLRMQLKIPSSREMTDDFQAVREWVAALRETRGFRINTRTFRHQVLGENTIPETVWLDSLGDAVRLLRKQTEFERFAALVSLTRERNPALLGWVRKWPLKALALALLWPKLLDVIMRLQANPRPYIYMRQVSIAGIDSKFIEQNRAVLIPVLDLSLPPKAIDFSATGVRGFERRFGFRTKPLTVRFRVLDSQLELLPGRDRDITLSADDFGELGAQTAFGQRIRRVFVTENEINFLVFPPLENSLVVFGAGYGFDALSHAPWLSDCQIYYWGDIDTHGFAILDQLRHRHPHTSSFLMDEATLLAHREFWGTEHAPENRQLQRLSGEERQLYQDLQNNRFGEQLRLEQEQIDFGFLLLNLPAAQL